MVAVLVVDDEPDLRQVLADLLMEEGVAVRTAGDGHAALALHMADSASVILSDVMMPRLDGLGLARALREQGDHTPMVLMSAVPRPELPDGVGWLPKPFDFEEVLAAIAELAPVE